MRSTTAAGSSRTALRRGRTRPLRRRGRSRGRRRAGAMLPTTHDGTPPSGSTRTRPSAEAHPEGGQYVFEVPPVTCPPPLRRTRRHCGRATKSRTAASSAGENIGQSAPTVRSHWIAWVGDDEDVDVGEADVVQRPAVVVATSKSRAGELGGGGGIAGGRRATRPHRRRPAGSTTTLRGVRRTAPWPRCAGAGHRAFGPPASRATTRMGAACQVLGEEVFLPRLRPETRDRRRSPAGVARGRGAW